jgi:hypothetical protein
MTKTILRLVALALVLAPRALWACTMTLQTAEPEPESGHDYTISWTAVPGASRYTVIEAAGDLEDVFGKNEADIGNDTSVEFEHFVAADTKFNYVVRAYSNSDPYDPLCAGTASVEVQGDTGVRDFAARGVIPVVGSAPGAYGAQFKTYLALHGNGQPLHGKIIFHRSGQAISDSDPSMPYDLSSDVRTQTWDDVVAAMGQSGIGSLDIVPTLGPFGSRTLPVIEVRVYNDAPNGTYGSAENVYYPGEVFQSASIAQTIHFTDARFRANVGVRTLESRVRATVNVFDAAGNLRTGSPKVVTIHETGMYMGSPEALFGLSLNPGDTMTVDWDGEAFPFHTITENQTNDPYVVVQGQAHNGGDNLAGFVH